MTKEKALEIFKFMLKSGKGTIDYWNGTIAEQRTAIEMAIKALEQETVSKETYDSEYLARKRAEQKLYEIQQNTSDDCVSRQAVLDSLMKYEKPCDDRQDFYLDSTTEFEEEIKALPPVTPTRKVGKWIYDSGSYKCPFCEHEIIGIEEDLNYYCKCGAEMRGVENG